MGHTGVDVREGKLRELWGEMRTVFSGRGNLVDSILPTVVFVLVNTFSGFRTALWSALGLAVVFAVYRLVRRQQVRYALAGLGGVAVATALAVLLGRAEGFFLPGVVTGILTAIACGATAFARRPLVAWTSHLVRRWPRDWYWHPRVRPAYSEVTLAWTAFFAARVLLQISLISMEQSTVASLVSLVAGWPATVVLLVASYLYGSWRLRSLGGPSVEEFEADAEPPWLGQRRGF